MADNNTILTMNNIVKTFGVENLDDLVKAKYLTQERFDKLTKGEAIR